MCYYIFWKVWPTAFNFIFRFFQNVFFQSVFLAVTWQLNRTHCPLVGWSGTTNNQSLHNTTEWPQTLVTFETFVQSDEKTWHDQKKVDKDKYKDKDKDILRTPPKSNPRDLWHLRHWLQFWQLRTWIYDNLCDLTINCDTGQHSQFLRCFSSKP